MKRDRGQRQKTKDIEGEERVREKEEKCVEGRNGKNRREIEGR